MAWYDDLITIERWPATDVNRQALILWAQSEGMPPEANNWLAISSHDIGWMPPPAPYSEPFYATYAEGVEATGHFLAGSNYDQVRHFFSIGTNLVDIYLAINGSPWCSGCQSGHYPIDLYQAVAADLGGGGSEPTPGPGQTPSSVMDGWWAEMMNWYTNGAPLVNAAFAEATAIFEAL